MKLFKESEWSDAIRIVVFLTTLNNDTASWLLFSAGLMLISAANLPWLNRAAGQHDWERGTIKNARKGPW